MIDFEQDANDAFPWYYPPPLILKIENQSRPRFVQKNPNSCIYLDFFYSAHIARVEVVRLDFYIKAKFKSTIVLEFEKIRCALTTWERIWARKYFTSLLLTIRSSMS
jgi:hypothetical protein